MTTWLPAVCGAWLAIVAAMIATDPIFTTGRDHAVGWAVGLFTGALTGAVLYAGIRAIAWIWGGV